MKKTKYAVMALLTILSLGGCVASGTGNYDQLRAQVSQHEQYLQQLNTQLASVQPAQADTWSQVQSIRQEMSAMRGELESISNALSQAGGAPALTDALARHERALRLIETQLAMDLQLNQPGTNVGYPGVNPGTAGGFDAPGVVTPPADVTQPPSTAVNPSVTPGSMDTAQALYDAGMAAFNSRRYEQGLKAFSDFTETYPQHNLVSNSWFWQGECHYQLRNYAAAALAYEEVIAKFPNSNKAPSSYLKQGLCFVHLDRKDAASERLNQLIQKYPKAPEATRAQQEIQTYKL